MTRLGLSRMFILSFALASLGCASTENGGNGGTAGEGGAGSGGTGGQGGIGGAGGQGGIGGAGGQGGIGGIGGAGGQAGASGLVAYYPFSGNAQDESGNGNDGSAVGGAALAMDRFGSADSAYQLDGTSGYIEIPDSADFNFNQPLTVTAWIYLNDNTSASIVGQWGPGGFGGDAFVLSVRSGKLRLTLPRPGLYELDSQTTLTEMEWLFVGVVYDGADVKLFINGTQDASDTFAAAQVDSDQPVRIGLEEIISGDPAYLDGLVDDVRIYNRALSDSEIDQLYQP